MTIRSRCIAAALVAAAVAAGSSACSQGSAKVMQKTAQLTVGGDSRTSHVVSCTQVQWLLTMDISADPANIRVVLQLDHDKPEVQSVNIDNFNGFSGVADAGAGKVEATFAAGKYHITGIAHRTNAVNPEDSGTADFTIDAAC